MNDMNDMNGMNTQKNASGVGGVEASKWQLIEILNSNILSVKNTLRMIADTPYVSLDTLKSIASLLVESDIATLKNSIEKISNVK